MAYSIHDKNGNIYTDDIAGKKSTAYISLKCAQEALAKLPVGYKLKDRHTGKWVESK